jgi:ubiquitin-protein ligase
VTDGLDRASILTQLQEIVPDLLHEQAWARVVLEDIGLGRRRQPDWTRPREFWSEALHELGNGAVINGVEALVLRVAEQYPGHPGMRDLARQVNAAGRPAEAPAEQAEIPPGPGGRPTGRDEQAAPVERKAPLPEPVVVPEAARYPTLTLINSDRHDEFLRLVRSIVSPNAELCYASSGQAAVLIPDPGDRAGEIQRMVSAQVRDWGNQVDVAFDSYLFRPHLLRRLTAYGPDGDGWELRNVPNTTPVSDIPWAVFQNYADDTVRRAGRYMRTTVDRIREDGSAERLAPDLPLSAAGVEDGDELRVAAEATAGSGAPGLFREGVLRARAQIHRYEKEHPGFVIAETDDDYLPYRYIVEFSERSFAPPPDLSRRPLVPLAASEHRVEILLPADFPVGAPHAIWLTPIFHPNITDRQIGPYRSGLVCLGALMDAYRPDLDFAELCRMLVDMAAYRRYDARLSEDEDAEGYLNKDAARWAREEGQEAIRAIAGAPMPPPVTEDDERPRRPLDVVALDDWDAQGDGR